MSAYKESERVFAEWRRARVATDLCARSIAKAVTAGQAPLDWDLAQYRERAARESALAAELDAAQTAVERDLGTCREARS